MAFVYSMADTWNAIGTTFNSILMNVTDGAAGNPVGAAASQLLNLQTNGTKRFGVRMPHFALAADTTPFLDMVDIWNTSGAGVGIRYNVTNTASTSLSRLIDLQVGGSSRFNVTPTALNWGDGGQTLSITTSAGSTIFTTSTTQVLFTAAFGILLSSNTGRIVFGVSSDVIIERDAANVFCQRNGTTAQKTNIYNTYTSATNFEAFTIDWRTTANLCIIGPQVGSSGTLRPMQANFNTTTVGALPAAATARVGARMFVSDALLPAILTTVAGGGAVPVPVYSDGTDWKVA